MYKIAIAPEQQIPQVDKNILKLFLHPRLHSESKVLICYIINQYEHNPFGQFQKNIFQKSTGIKRSSCDKALLQLFEKDILKRIKCEDGETVFELDWDALKDFLDDESIIIKAGFAQHSKQVTD